LRLALISQTSPDDATVMAAERHDRSASASIEDAALLQRLSRGDEAALKTLMGRYDALVRYAIQRASRDRCRRDPEWLDSLASETWAGLMQSLRAPRARLPQSLRAYLVQVARNRCISALKANPIAKFSLDEGESSLTEAASSDESDPAEVTDRLEELELLRSCLAELTSSDRAIYAQLPAIVERRWKVAAAALKVRESTLRSRWERITGQLQRCMGRKTQNRVAPEAKGRDK